MEIKVRGTVKADDSYNLTPDGNKKCVLTNMNMIIGDIVPDIVEDTNIRWEEYCDLALRTEGKDYSVYLKRVDEPNVKNLLIFELGQLIEVIKELDKLKKYIFYGKKADFVVAPTSGMIIVDETEIRLLHGILGIATECGELIEKYLTMVEGDQSIDLVGWKKELGDVFWYLALCVKTLNLENVLETNIAKLSARYPEKFTEELAQSHKGD